MKKLQPFHYWLIIAGLLASNLLWIFLTLEVAEQRDVFKRQQKEQKETIEGLYCILEYKDTLLAEK